MGTRKNVVETPARTSLAGALFSLTQQRVLALLFGQPHRSFFSREIIRLVGAGSGAVQRELKKLADSGLVVVSRVGTQKHYQVNPDSPIYAELCSLIRKTIGLVEPLRQALEAERKAIQLALVYGSVAKGADTASSDVDLLIVSDDLTLEQVYQLLAEAEHAIGRKINPTLYTAKEYRWRQEEGNPFLKRVLAGDTLTLIGTSRNDEERTGKPRKDPQTQI